MRQNSHSPTARHAQMGLDLLPHPGAGRPEQGHNPLVAVIGDSRAVLPHLAACSVDLVITSPPYFGLKNYGHSNGVSLASLDAYLSDLHSVLSECHRVLKDGTMACIVVGQFTSPRASLFLPGAVARLMEETGFRYRHEYVWVKPLGVQGIWNRGTTAFLKSPWPRRTMINIHHEHILVYQKGDQPAVRAGESPLPEDVVKRWCWSVWTFPPSRVKGHPAPFPEEIPRRLISLYSYPGEVVLDPFLGSGTTLRAAAALGRACLGIEVSADYLPLIAGSAPGVLVVRHDQGEPLPRHV
jgi:DNA modification methylase